MGNIDEIDHESAGRIEHLQRQAQPLEIGARALPVILRRRQCAPIVLGARRIGNPVTHAGIGDEPDVSTHMEHLDQTGRGIDIGFDQRAIELPSPIASR
jgi:hypothetical protein